MTKKNRNQRPQNKRFRLRWRYQVVGERKVKQSWLMRAGEKLWKLAAQAVVYWIDPRRSRYSNEELRRLRAERGVGSIKRVHPTQRATWQPTAR